LRTAWGKLDAAKQKELRDRYFQARLQYLAKTGEPADQATKTANEEADGLAKGMYVPHVIEPSAGVDRLLLALLCHAYDEEEVPDAKGNKEVREVLRFSPRVAPIKVGVFPLLRNKPELVSKALEVRDLLRAHMNVFFDDGGAIGRRYRRQDEAGTPFGVTIDFETLGERGPELKDTVTLRHRDSMQQERVKISDLLGILLPQVQ
jgi:glycyl-tRNA synthetase